MKVFKATLMSKDDHELHYDKVVNVTNGKEFTVLSDALNDITVGRTLLLWYLGIQFDLGDKGTIELEKLQCNNRDISSIYSNLIYLSELKCPVDTYFTILDFVDDVCTKGDEKYLGILLTLAELQSR